MSRKQFTCLDLFSGAGGLSRGFYDAGYEVVLGVDFDEAALKTFQENHGQAQAMQLDLFHHENIMVLSGVSFPLARLYCHTLHRGTYPFQTVMQLSRCVSAAA